MGVIAISAQMGHTIRGESLVEDVLSSCATIDGWEHEPHHLCTLDIQQDAGNTDYYGKYYSDHYYDHSYAGVTHRPHRALTIIIILFSVLWSSGEARRYQRQVHAPRDPQSITQAQGTYVNTHMYEKLRNTHIDINIVRTQPSAAKAAHGLSIIIMNITSWNSKVYRYVASLKHDVIFIQEHRKTMSGQIKVPEG